MFSRHDLTNEHATPTFFFCTRDQVHEFNLVLLFLAVVPILAVGCSTSRQSVVSSGTTSAAIGELNEARVATKDDARGADAGDTSSVQAVAFESNPTESDVAFADEFVQLVVPQGLESVPLPSEVNFAEGLTLEAIEQMALANNPAVQQAAAAAARASGIRNQVGLKPNPTFGFNGSQVGDAGTDQYSVFVEQTFVRGDKLAWNQQVIGHDVNAMNWLVETQRQRLRTDIRLAFYEALAAQKRLELSREFRVVAKKGVTVSEEQLKAAIGTRPDVLQSEIQLNEVDLAIQQAEFEYSAAWNELAALAGVSGFGQTKLIGDLDSHEGTRDADTEFAQIASRSPLLAAAQARVDRASSNLQRQHAQPTPNVSAQLGVGHDLATGREFANVQLSLPLPVRNKNQGNIQAAHAEYCEATQNVERIRMSIRRDLARVMREYQVAEATVQQYESTILPKAEEALELMQGARDAGEFDFLRVLIARRAYFDANIKYVIGLGQLAQANAKLDGLLLTGGLSDVTSYDGDDSLRGQALSGE
ncbi:MAG: TolC family protein [Planctomycetaceae bacterium]